MTTFIALQLSNIWGRVWVWIRGGNEYLWYLSSTRVLKFGKNSNLYPNLIKAEKFRQVGLGLDRYMQGSGFDVCLCIMGEHSKEEYNYETYSSLSFILEWLYMHAWNFFGLRFQTQFCNHINLSKVSIKK